MSLYPSLFLLGSGLVFKRLIFNFFLLYCYMFLVLLCMIHQCWSFKENLCILSSKFKNFLHLWCNFPQPPDFILVCNFSSCSRVPFFSFYHFKQKCHITEVKWCDVTYGQVWWPILGICALHLTHPKCTHTAVNTHTPWTHTRSSGQPPTYNSCRTWDSNSQPLDYESDSLTIRPRLTQIGWECRFMLTFINLFTLTVRMSLDQCFKS